MYTVTISERGKPPVKLDFDKPEITIGRVRGNDIVLQKNNVSKRHAKLIIKDGQFIIVDQKSTNGTIVNARKITSATVVREDDKICIGDFILTLKFDDRPAARPSGPQPAPPVPPPPLREPLKPQPPLEPPRPAPAFGPSAPSRAPSGPLPRVAAPPGPIPKPPSHPQRPPAFEAPAPPELLGVGRPRPPEPSKPTPIVSEEPPPAPPEVPQAATLKPGAPPQALAEMTTETGEIEPGRGRSTLSGFGHADAEGPVPAARFPRAASHRHTPSLLAPTPVKARVDRPRLAADLRTPTAPNPAVERAQAEALSRVLERTKLQSLPRRYPPKSADLAEQERIVDRVLDTLGPERLLDGLDRRELLSLVTFELVGLGPLELLLDDPSVSEIFVNGPNRIFVRRDGVTQAAGVRFGSADTYDLAVERLLGAGQPVDRHLTSVRLSDGTRIDVLLPPLAAPDAVITVRKTPSHYRTLSQLIEDGCLSQPMAAFLRQTLDAGRTLLIAGPRGSGKTELLRALGAGIPDGVRIVTVEETARLQLHQSSAVSLEFGDIGAARNHIMSYALQLDPERVLVDDLGPHDAYDWILGSAFAAVGSVGALTANGERDALTRLETMAIPATPHHSIRGIREQIARAVHFVVVLSTQPGQPRRVTKLVEVQGLELDTYRLQDVFYHQPSGDEQGGAFHPTGHIPAFYEELRRSGAGADLSIFRT